jgi:hypothetical protein
MSFLALIGLMLFSGGLWLVVGPVLNLQSWQAGLAAAVTYLVLLVVIEKTMALLKRNNC